MKLFKFELYTPYCKFFSGEIEALTLTLPDGEITIYADHSFMLTPVLAGFAKIKTRDGWRNAFVADGILEVKSHNTIVLSDAAEWPEQIDRERAEKAMAAAEEALRSGTFKFETNAAEGALRRAKLRLKVKESGCDTADSNGPPAA